MPGTCQEEYRFSCKEVLVTCIRICCNAKCSIFEDSVIKQVLSCSHGINKALICPAPVTIITSLLFIFLIVLSYISQADIRNPLRYLLDLVKLSVVLLLRALVSFFYFLNSCFLLQFYVYFTFFAAQSATTFRDFAASAP